MDPFRQFRHNVIAVEKKRLVLYESQQIQRHLTKRKKNENSRRKKKQAKKKIQEKAVLLL